MAVFLFDTWVHMKGKRKENEDVVKKIFQYNQKHLEQSKYVKSLRYLKHGIGGKPVGRRVLITEFENLTDMDRFFNKLRKDKDWQQIMREWTEVIEPNTLESQIWNDQFRDLWVEK